jgi:hypothetical protein
MCLEVVEHLKAYLSVIGRGRRGVELVNGINAVVEHDNLILTSTDISYLSQCPHKEIMMTTNTPQPVKTVRI